MSTELREEYEDLLRYAVVTPVIDLSMKARKSQGSQHHPSPVVPPRPQTPPPHATRQPEGALLLEAQLCNMRREVAMIPWKSQY